VTENAPDTTAEDPRVEPAASEPVTDPAPPSDEPSIATDLPETSEPVVADEPAAEPITEASPAAEAEAPAAAEEPAAEPITEASPAAEAVTAEGDAPAAPASDEAPQIGPKIIGMAAPTPPPPPVQRLPRQERQQRPRRRRLNATQKHRNVFFARLNEFRRSTQPVVDGEEGVVNEPAAEGAAPEAPAAETPAVEATETPAAEATEAAPVEEAPAAEATEVPAAEEAPVEESPAAEAPAAEEAPASESPAAEAPAAEEAPTSEVTEEAPAAEEAPQPQQQQRRSSPPPPIDRPRLIAAIDRAGGPEVVQEALQPKRDENGQPLKWATVCADACKGLKPGDPIFGAWIRLAATPVSAIKNELGLPERGGRDDRGRGRGRGGPGQGRGGPGDRDRGPRRPREDRVSREDLEKLGTGGRVGATIRIIGSGDEEKKERERRRKEEREAKRQAERDRLARLGY
jgi:hypothetical protein